MDMEGSKTEGETKSFTTGTVVVSEQELEELSQTLAQLESSDDILQGLQFTAKNNQDVKLPQGNKTAKQPPPRSKGYQESRKYHQDRRDSRRKGADDHYEV